MALKREPVRSGRLGCAELFPSRRIMPLRLGKSIFNPVHAIFKKPLMMTTLLLILERFSPYSLSVQIVPPIPSLLRTSRVPPVALLFLPSQGSLSLKPPSPHLRAGLLSPQTTIIIATKNPKNFYIKKWRGPWSLGPGLSLFSLEIGRNAKRLVYQGVNCVRSSRHGSQVALSPLHFICSSY